MEKRSGSVRRLVMGMDFRKTSLKDCATLFIDEICESSRRSTFIVKKATLNTNVSRCHKGKQQIARNLFATDEAV